jgi:filamentous hemagglutinin
MSAVLSLLVLVAIDPMHASLDQGQLAVLAAVATLVGGGLAGLAGQNAMAGAMAAQKKALNNSADHWVKNESEAQREQDALHKHQSKETAQLGEGSVVNERDGVSVLCPNPIALGATADVQASLF